MSEHHEPSDFEDIPPVPPTPESVADMAKVASIVEMLDFYGFDFTEEPGWAHRQPTYQWESGGPSGVQLHHTVSVPYGARSAYPAPEGLRTDGRVIANALIQPNGEINLVAAGPANYSSGTGRRNVRDDFVRGGIRYHGPQSENDDSPAWYGNRSYINIEVVHRGDGSTIPPAQEKALIGLVSVICFVFDWDATAVIAHEDHTRRKIDPRFDGQYAKEPYSVAGIQDRVQQILDSNDLTPGEPVQLFKIGQTRDDYEEIVWMLFVAAGGTINPNANSAQVQSHLPWKDSVRLVQAEDFEFFGDIIGLHPANIDLLIANGLWPLGKEVAKLRDVLYREQ